ncbi:protein FAM169B [Protobothrops mucrosquamatus]|uniref:protein FAM169B n=1 Tax=Protobothrops mucrosquamatus TaxID=103944 RepID=UPI0010FAE737|nr:protein FAM169B [Protobothrops mucrosquamatus]
MKCLEFGVELYIEDCLFLVDIKEENVDNPETGPCKNQAKLMEEALSAAEDFSLPGQEHVQTFQERIVLFVLNCIVFGLLERSSTDNTVFVPHAKKEHAKIFWKSGEAAAFYTVKRKGNLCDGHTSQCYLLPVLDTMFVRKKFRRRGLAMQMLQDFCQSFPSEEALGLSCPLSAEMEKVCQKFLETHPMEQPRLWEAEAPGDWTQRVNIWLKLQLEQSFPKNADRSSPTSKGPDDEAEEEPTNTVS